MLIVGGSFDTGKPSGYVSKLAGAVCRKQIAVLNGGTWDNLLEACLDAIRHDVVIWMPDVSNDRPKLVGDIKRRAPHTLLVTSKRNDDEKYSFSDLVARALKTRSNLMLEVSRGAADPSKFVTTVMDPLGNVFINKELDIKRATSALLDRIDFLQSGSRMRSVCRVQSGSRMRSVCRGDMLRVNMSDDAECFFEIVRAHAQTFHELIHGANPTRMMGNASFMFVSKRDIDKRDIGLAGFVPVSLTSEHVVEYYAIKGNESKPSVDSPINLRLYNQLPRIRYMLHSHTYVEGAPFTAKVLACGDLREAHEVLKLINVGAKFFSVNLRGHGSLVGAEHPEMLRGVKYVARPIPEFHTIP
jgi:hypothetical protein